AKRIAKIAGSRLTGPRSVVIELENLLVEVVRRRRRSKDRVDIRHGRGFKCCAGQDYISSGGKDEVHALGIKKEKQLIFDDRASQRSCPLVRDVERARISYLIVEPVVGIQHPSVPVVGRISVKRISSRFCDEVDVRAGGPAELRGISAAD